MATPCPHVGDETALSVQRSKLRLGEVQSGGPDPLSKWEKELEPRLPVSRYLSKDST